MKRDGEIFKTNIKEMVEWIVNSINFTYLYYRLQVVLDT